MRLAGLKKKQMTSHPHLPAWGGIIMWWNDNNTHRHWSPKEVNHLFVGQCCYCNFADFNQSASLPQSCLPGVTIRLHLLATKFECIITAVVRCFILQKIKVHLFHLITRIKLFSIIIFIIFHLLSCCVILSNRKIGNHHHFIFVHSDIESCFSIHF